MEQGYEKNGLNLDPMFFWQYVMAKGQRVRPRVAFIDLKLEKEMVDNIADELPYVDFIIEEESVDNKVKSSKENVLYRWRDRIEYKNWLKTWTTVDYGVGSKENVLSKQVALCGVKMFENVDDFLALGENIRVFNNVDRIENWESARKLLTN